MKKWSYCYPSLIMSWANNFVYNFPTVFWENYVFLSLKLHYYGKSEISLGKLKSLHDCMGCSLPASSIHGIFQARMLEWVALSFSRGSSRPRDWTQIFCIPVRLFTIWATKEAQDHIVKFSVQISLILMMFI